MPALNDAEAHADSDVRAGRGDLEYAVLVADVVSTKIDTGGGDQNDGRG